MHSNDPPSRYRRDHLIDGRRVRISDLLDARLLRAGDVLTYRPSHSDTIYEVVVTEQGQLRFPDGREFSTPTGAATAARSARAVHSWIIWRVGEDGPSLHELRQRLLQTVADYHGDSGADPTSDTPVSQAARARFAMLNEARERAGTGDPKALTVRDLLRLWGLQDRDRTANEHIEADLTNHDLTTAPDFRAVSLDRTVKLVPLSEIAESAPPAGPTGEESSTLRADLLEESSADIGLTLGNLLNGEDSLVSVSPSATLEEVITIMLLNDFSQLAVLTNPYTLHGAVTWQSIARAKHANPDATFSGAIVPAQVFNYDTRLLRVLETLKSEEFIFVREPDRKISGIITAADVVHKYDETATPFLLIGEVDQELRQLIQGTFDVQTVRDACAAAGHNFRSIGSMTMGNYQAVLDNPACWQQLGWPLDRGVFIRRLDEIRKVRNTVMHFNPDPIRSGDVAKLRNFLDLIRTFHA